MSIILTHRMFRGRNTEMDRTVRWFDWLLFLILTVNHVRCESTMGNATMKSTTACTMTNITDLQLANSSCDSGVTYLFIKNSHFEKFPHIFDIFPNLQSVDLSGAGVQHIETEVFRAAVNLSTLDMSESNMQTLANDLFTRLNNLTSLDISNSGIKVVEKYAFHGLSNLKKLDLSGNEIVALDGQLFHPMSILQTIRLSNNKIEVIDADTFMHNTKLMFVYLDGNSIAVVDSSSFIRCPLKTLDLASNNLMDLDLTTMKNLTELIVNGNHLSVLKVPSVAEKISAANNSIAAVESDGKCALKQLRMSSNHFTDLSNLINFENLEFLDLSKNHLRYFSFADVKFMTRLNELQLCGNKLPEINVDDVVTNLPKLKFISLSTKHWPDSYTEQLKRDLKKRNIELGQDRNVIPDDDSPVPTTVRPPVTSGTTVNPASPTKPSSGDVLQQLSEITWKLHDLEYRLGANAAADSKKIDGRLSELEDKLSKSNSANDAKLEVLRSSFKVYEVLVIIMAISVTAFIVFKLVMLSKRILSGMNYRRAQSSDPIFSEQDL